MPVRAVTKTAAGAVAVSAAVAAAAVVAVPVVPVGCGVLAAKRMRLCGEERRADETLARLEAKRVAEYEAYLELALLVEGAAVVGAAAEEGMVGGGAEVGGARTAL